MNAQPAFQQTAAGLLNRVSRAAAALWHQPTHANLQTAFDDEALIPVPEVAASTWAARMQAELECANYSWHEADAESANA